MFIRVGTRLVCFFIHVFSTYLLRTVCVWKVALPTGEYGGEQGPSSRTCIPREEAGSEQSDLRGEVARRERK